MEDKKISFEEKLNRLSEIATKIEGETLPLDESIKLFEEGQKLIKELESELKEAKTKIEEITKDSK